MLKRLASQTVTYGLTSILGRLIGNLLLPLQTERLSLNDFSVLSEVLAYVAVLAVIFPLGLETALFKFSNDIPEEKNSTEQKIISLQILVAITILPFSFAWLTYKLPGLIPTDILVICLTLLADCITGIFTVRFRNHSDSKRFLLVKLGSILLMILLNLLFLSKIPWIDAINPLGINFRLIIYLNFLTSFLVFFFIPKSLIQFQWKTDWLLYRKVMVFSLPILMMSIVGVSNDIFGRIWLEELTPSGFYGNLPNSDLIGIYSGCAKIAIFINLGIQAYRYAADPFFFSIQDKENTATYLANSFTWFTATGLLALVSIACNLNLIVAIFLRKPEFMLGLQAIFFLLLANFFFGVYYNLSFWYKFTNRTYWGSMISVFGLVTNAGLNFILVPILGMTGSAIALLICSVGMCIVSFFKGRQFFVVGWAYGKFFTMLLVGIFLCVLSQTWQPREIGIQIVRGVFLPLIFLSLVVFLQKDQLFKRFKIVGSS